MPSKKRAGKSYKEQYTAYKTQNRQTKNKIAQLQKVCNKQPDNENASKALKKAITSGKPHLSGRRSSGHICKGTPFTIIDPQTGNEVIRRYNKYILTPVVKGLRPKTAKEQLINLGIVVPRKKHARRNKKTFRHCL